MDVALRSNRAGICLGLGILSLFSPFFMFPFMIPVGPLAWWLATRDLRDMKSGRMDPSGRTLTQLGLVFGIAGTVLVVLSALLIALVLPVVVQEQVKPL